MCEAPGEFSSIKKAKRYIKNKYLGGEKIQGANRKLNKLKLHMKRYGEDFSR